MALTLSARRPDWELPALHSGLQLAPMEQLWEQRARLPCTKCGKSRLHYCYDCVVALTPCPHVALPFRVSIITHHDERASKNTGVQVAILAEGQVDLHDMGHAPEVDKARCAVLFPSDDAVGVEDVEPDSIDRLFIIDSRWQKAKELVKLDLFKGMRAVRLSETRSAFWRYHTKGIADEGVCTAEALYFFLGALSKQGKFTDPRFTEPHAFDNLLWYFVFQYQIVQDAAQKRNAEHRQRSEDRAEAGPDNGDDGGGQPPGKRQKNQQFRKQQQGQPQGQRKRPPEQLQDRKAGHEEVQGVLQQQGVQPPDASNLAVAQQEPEEDASTSRGQQHASAPEAEQQSVRRLDALNGAPQH